MQGRRWDFTRVLVVLLLCATAACDSENEVELPDVSGQWESNTFINEDQRGTASGQAVFETHFDQDGEELSGSGLLHLPQARIELPFDVDGTVGDRSVQFITLYDTAPPETVTCSVESDTHLRCFKGSVRFNLTREQQ